MLKTFEIVDVSIFKPSTGWFVAESREGEKVVGTSIIPPFGWITVEADHVNDARFGEQWKCKSVEYEDLEAITLALLESGLLKGINEGKAEAVFKAFGSDLWTILAAAEVGDFEYTFKGRVRNPYEILRDAKGVGKVVARQMVESWKKEKFTFTAAISAIRCGLTVRQFRDIAMNDGGREKFYKMVHNEEPYNIYDLVNFGIEFEKVDKIAMTDWADKPAIDFDSPIRFSGAVKHAMRAWTKDGHLCAPVEGIEQDVIDLIGAGSVMESLERPESYGLKLFEGSVYLHDDYMMEAEFAQKIKQIVMTPPNHIVGYLDAETVQEYADIDLHPTQVDAVLMALRNKVSVITGGPGVGKTTLLKVITDILTDRGVPFYLTAFMGSAARRMRLATEYDAKTLHSQFNLFGAEQMPIKKGYLIIDEVSTISSDLAYDVVSCCFDEVSILFIGDADQLPPVGRGEVFVQLLESKLPRTRLTHLYRNGGAIAAACRDVNQGKMPAPDNKDFFLINKCREADIPDRLKKAETYFNEQGWTGAQIITPMNDKAGVGRKALNSMMQKLRNPDGDVIPFTEIRTGDAVVHIKNNYELRVYNGMVGACTARTDDARVLLQKVIDRGENPIESFPDWTFQEEQISVLEVMFEDETFPVTYKANQLSELQLGYAITAHKAQGNQFPYVFVILPELPPMLSLRQIVYTAMSRAKQKLVVIAAPGVMERCITNTKILRRNSKLASFINEMYELEPA